LKHLFKCRTIANNLSDIGAHAVQQVPSVHGRVWNSSIHHISTVFALPRASALVSFFAFFVLLIALLAIGRSVFLLRKFAVHFFLVPGRIPWDAKD